MIISEVQRNFQEELLISLNNIFFLQKKNFSLLTEIKGEKMFLAYAQISANFSLLTEIMGEKNVSGLCTDFC